MKKLFFAYLRCFALLILLFSAGMILVYTIPNEALEPGYSKSLEQIGKEDVYANLLFNSDADILDNFTDRIMLGSCWVQDEGSVIRAAFDNNGYPRYWNGYLLTLRPMLTQFSYQQIRYINMLLLLTLFCFCFSGIHRTLGAVTAFGFALSMAACFLIFVGESLQYFSVFLITFVTTALILYVPRFREPEPAGVLLFAAGMVTNFFDLLTAPLLSLGVPLIVLFSLQERREGKDGIGFLVRMGISWAAGYALCWVSKWAIGSLVLQRNIFEDALTTGKFRMGGNDAYPLDRGLMLKLNFETYFFAKGRKPAVFIPLAWIGCLVYEVRKRKFRPAPFALTLLIGLLPYAWYMVFANHSQLHYFYTYRIQAVTLFAAFAAIQNAFSAEKKSR